MKENTNPKATSSRLSIEKISENSETEDKTLLVIDDELGPRESLRILFKDYYKVILASNGDEGIARARENDVDIIILDLRMPGKDGLTTLEEIRKVDENVPVIILTGYGDMDAAKKSIRFGAIEFMSKPFDINMIQSVVKRGMEKSRKIKRAERLLEKLKNLNTGLEARIEKTEKMATIGQMSAEIIHDVNNILSVIYGYAQLLASEVKDEDLNINSKYVKTIESEIQRCRNLTKSVMNLTKTKTVTGEININSIVKDIVEFLQNSNKARDVNFQTLIKHDIPFVRGDREQLYQAFFNVVLNGINALEGKGTIQMETTSKDSWVILKIRDSGAGIPENLIGKVSEPLYSTDYQKGAGLGLSITSRIIKNHGGCLEIGNSEKHGAEVVIMLPAIQQA